MLQQPLKSHLISLGPFHTGTNWESAVTATPIVYSIAPLSQSIHASVDEEPHILASDRVTSLSKTLHPLISVSNVIKKSEHINPALDFSKNVGCYVLCHVAYGLLCFRDLGGHADEAILFNRLIGEVLELPRPLAPFVQSITYGI